MKNLTKISFIALLGIMPFLSHTQITLTAADFDFTTQDSVLLVIADSTGVAIPDTGANKTWDYSNLVTTSTTKFSTGPDVSSSIASVAFPSANVIVKGPNVDAFYYKDNSVFFNLGIYVKNGNPYIVSYSDSAQVLAFPFTYGDSFEDTAFATGLFGGGGFTQTLYISSDIAGYGQLNLPSMTYPNVLQEVSLVTQVLETSANTDSVLGTTYAFYAPNYERPILAISVTTVFRNGSLFNQSKNVSYFGGYTFINVDELSRSGDLGLELYPLPVRDNLNISGIEESSPFVLLNAIGEIVQRGILTSAQPVVEMGNLSPGNYILSVELPRGTANLKVIKD